jgi:hypothetical protein
VIVLMGAGPSPGVTTLAMVATAVAAERGEVLLVEADPAGGAVAGYAEIPWDPGLVSLAAASWGTVDRPALIAHAQPLGRAGVIVGPGTGQEATSALVALGAGFPAGLARFGGTVVVDVGRMWPTSPATPVVSAAALAVVVVRQQARSPLGTGAAMAKGAGLVAWLSSVEVRAAVVVVGDKPFGGRDVAEYLGAPVLAVLPEDARAATLAWHPGGAGKGSSLVRAWRDAVDAIGQLLDAPRGGPGVAGGEQAPAVPEVSR